MKNKKRLIDDEIVEKRIFANINSDDNDEDVEIKESLPILNPNGKWTSKITKIKKEKIVETECKEQREEEEPAVVDKSFAEIKAELADCAVQISEDPEKHFSAKSAIIFQHLKSQDEQVTLLAIFKDIIPGYMIRDLEEEDSSKKLSKEVLALKKYEHSILKNYLKYLAALEERKSSIVAVRCLCELLVSAHHFNGFDQIAKLVSASAMSRSDILGDVASEAIDRLFSLDQIGKYSLQIMKNISSISKNRNYRNIPPRTLKTLLSLRLRLEINVSKVNNSVVKPKKHVSKRQKKELKAKKEQLAMMAEAEAQVSAEEQRKWNSEMVSHLFRIYFGFLKNYGHGQGHDEYIGSLQLVLNGISKFSGFISNEYFYDLLHTLMKLTNLNPEEALQLSLTTSTIHHLIQQDSHLSSSLDLKFVHCLVYNNIPNCTTNESIRDLLRHCLKSIFNPKLMIPHVRLAAIAQRLADQALKSKQSFYLDFLFEFIQDHPTKLLSLLDKETFGRQAYSENSRDPDISNPFSRSLTTVLQSIQKSTNDKAILSSVGKILRLK